MSKNRAARRISVFVNNTAASSHLKKKTLDKIARSATEHLNKFVQSEGFAMASSRSKNTNTSSEIERLTESDVSTLSALATVSEANVELYKSNEPDWVELINPMKNRLETPFARSVARYLLKETVQSGDQTSSEDKDACELAETMMRNVRPGFAQRARLDSASQVSRKK
jgi:hypothetical protein